MHVYSVSRGIIEEPGIADAQSAEIQGGRYHGGVVRGPVVLETRHPARRWLARQRERLLDCATHTMQHAPGFPSSGGCVCFSGARTGLVEESDHHEVEAAVEPCDPLDEELDTLQRLGGEGGAPALFFWRYFFLELKEVLSPVRHVLACCRRVYRYTHRTLRRYVCTNTGPYTGGLVCRVQQ